MRAFFLSHEEVHMFKGQIKKCRGFMKAALGQRREAPHLFAALLFSFFIFAAANKVAALEDAPAAALTSAEYRAFLHALGQKNYPQADSLLQILFRRDTIPPEVFEAAPMLFVYQKKWREGFAFFDSLRKREQQTGDALGALAILRHHEYKSAESLEYLKKALAASCNTLRPYELFITKSYETKRSAEALQLLTELNSQNPGNWRYRFALAQWHSSAREPGKTCELVEELLKQGYRHWRLYYMLGGNLSYLGKYHEALARYQEGLQFCEANRDDEGCMRMWYGIAETQSTLGERAEAKAALQRAESLMLQNGNELFASRIALPASQFLINEQQWLAARDRLLVAREQAQRLAEGATLLRVYYNLMNLNRVIGSWEEAVAYTLKTAAVADSIGLQAYYLDMLSIVAAIDIEAGRYEQALAYLQELESNARQKNIMLHRVPFLLGQAKAFVALGRYHEAEPVILEGTELAKKSGTANQLIEFQQHLCAVWLHTGKRRQALQLLRVSIATAEKQNSQLLSIELKLLLAEAHLLENKIGVAQELLTRMLMPQSQTLPYKQRLQLLSLLAQTHMRQGNGARAIEIYAEAVALIASQTHVLNPSGLSTLSHEERTAYFGLSQAYLHTGETLKALTVTENAHDLIVRRKQLQARLLQTGTQDESFKRQLVRLDSLLAALRLEQARELLPAEKMILDGKIRAAEQERAQLMARMFPPQALTEIQNEIFPLEKFQAMLLARNELALKFFVGASHTLVFFLDGATLDAQEIAIGRGELQTLLTQIHALLTPAPDPQDSTYKARLDETAAHEVYRRLLVDWLKDRSATRLAIVPDDVLHALPFDLLVTTPPGEATQYLLHRFAIRNGLSFSSLLQAPQPRWQVSNVLMLADPNFSHVEAPQSSGPRDGEVFLPVGRKELEAVRQIIRIHQELTGDEANKTELFEALRRSDWFHFASHSISRAREPLFAEFVLALLARTNEPERAHAFEIFPMQLPTRLAILSACETARGTFLNGEGFEGFVQAFRAAGTPSVIASLWKVENHASAQFFEHYYNELLRGKSTSAALQAAKLKMLADTRYSVLDWAAFNYYGHDWMVEFEKPVGILPVALALGAIALLLLGGLLYFRKRGTR